MKRAAVVAGLGLIVLAALWIRTARLGLRPMHADEANQAVKFGGLLERGEYRYDPAEHHGPSLYYLTLPVARLAGRTTLAALDERTLRLVPALCGAAAVLLLALFGAALDRRALLAGALLMALSPVFVYYSRFYIQETLLACFGVGFLASLWRTATERSAGWAAASGLFAGLMFASKETAVILFAAAAFALVVLRPWRDSRDEGRGGRRAGLRLWLCGIGAFAVAAGLLYSSFLGHPRGIVDSVLAFGNYFRKAAGPGVHVKPWFYYLKSLAFFREGRGPIWSEALILILAAVGGIAALIGPGDRGSRLMRFVALDTLCAAAVYSAIPYKTPWNLLPFYAGFVILAGQGAAVLLDASRTKAIRAAVLVLLAAGVGHLGWESYRASFVFHSDSRNPWVYAQTVPDVFRLVARLDRISRARPEGKDLLIKVVADPSETWPLPWYLRSYRMVGYWTRAADAGGLEGVPVIICSVEAAEQFGPPLEEGFQLDYYGLRPGVLLLLGVGSGR
jgi:uncharacterized protein (TIGR03663 family)